VLEQRSKERRIGTVGIQPYDSQGERYRICTGEPHRCFDRRKAAMPDDDKDSLRAAIPVKPIGIGNLEELIRAADLSL
jgi:hypothetical protein